MSNNFDQENAENDKNLPVIAPEIIADPPIKLPRRKDSRLLPLESKKGKTAVVYLRIAQMAVRGFSTDQISEETGLSIARINKLLRSNKQIWDYITRQIQATFSEGDRILPQLYKKALISLDEELSSPSADVRQKARAQVFEMLKAMQMVKSTDEDSEDKRTIIFQQFFGTKSPISGKIKSMDDLIIQKRKERGLSTEVVEAEVEEGEEVDGSEE